MSLADFTVAALKGFAAEVGTWTNQGSLISITGHIAQIENAVAADIHAGETAAKAVLADLYSAFHGHQAAEPAAPVAAALVVGEPSPEIPPAAVPAPAVSGAVSPVAEAPAAPPSTESSTPSAPATDAPVPGA